MRINLVTPFAEKDAAKALGARWDPKLKVWYVQDVTDLAPFRRWLPQGAASACPAETAPAAPARTVTGPQGVAPAHCGCPVLPWEDCSHTRAGP